jgi:hypothetical protein
MDFPNLPTDNLYKFMALGGLALIIASLVVYASFYTKLQTAMDALAVDVATLQVDVHAAPKTAPPDVDLLRREAVVEAKLHSAKVLFITLLVLAVDCILLQAAGAMAMFYGFKQWNRLQAQEDALLFAELAQRLNSLRGGSEPVEEP